MHATALLPPQLLWPDLTHLKGELGAAGDESAGGHAALVPRQPGLLNGFPLLQKDAGGEIRQIFSGSRAGEKMLMIDACHAGGQSELPPINPEQAFQGSGMVTLASCTLDQQSLEDPNKSVGVFTHWVTRGLRGEARGQDRKVTVFELFQFVSQGVPHHANRVLPGHQQTPVFYGTLRQDFPIVELD